MDYTKGEWTIKNNYRVVDDNGRTIATSGKPDDIEAKANAHLIAAAPKMYEALRRFLESSACTNNCDPDDMSCDTNFARKALASAEGREE